MGVLTNQLGEKTEQKRGMHELSEQPKSVQFSTMQDILNFVCYKRRK